MLNIASKRRLIEKFFIASHNLTWKPFLLHVKHYSGIDRHTPHQAWYAFQIDVKIEDNGIYNWSPGDPWQWPNFIGARTSESVQSYAQLCFFFEEKQNLWISYKTIYLSVSGYRLKFFPKNVDFLQNEMLAAYQHYSPSDRPYLHIAS